jgi:predicted sulfurtransferase
LTWRLPETGITKDKDGKMKAIFMLWMVFLLGLGGDMAASDALAAEAPRIEKDELKANLGNPEVVVIDVRSYTDWLLSGDKVTGAVRENYRDFDGWNAKYPKDKTLVLYCA